MSLTEKHLIELRNEAHADYVAEAQRDAESGEHKNKRFNIAQSATANPMHGTKFVVIDGVRLPSGAPAPGAKVVSGDMSRSDAIDLADSMEAAKVELTEKQHVEKAIADVTSAVSGADIGASLVSEYTPAEGYTYVMYASYNKHRYSEKLRADVTTTARLLAHWTGFIANMEATRASSAAQDQYATLLLLAKRAAANALWEVCPHHNVTHIFHDGKLVESRPTEAQAWTYVFNVVAAGL